MRFMPKRVHAVVGGVVYHVLNRSKGRVPLFEHAGDYQAFERVLVEAHEKVSMRTLTYCVMPNHWHLVLWPRGDEDLAKFVHWLTVTHAKRWRAYRDTVGHGHVYQGRYKSFPVEEDDHFLTVCRYVERNALKANLVTRAQEWTWGAMRRRRSGPADLKAILADWPLERPRNWGRFVNKPLTAEEEEALAVSVKRGCPYGSSSWAERVAKRLGITSTFRPRGRPPKK
jgi:putative transposase